jgi:hypothetical protein
MKLALFRYLYYLWKNETILAVKASQLAMYDYRVVVDEVTA